MELDQGNILRVSGKRNYEKEEKGKYLLRERSSFNFSRSFKLPMKVKANEIQATYADGVLVVVVPKDEV